MSTGPKSGRPGLSKIENGGEFAVDDEVFVKRMGAKFTGRGVVLAPVISDAEHKYHGRVLVGPSTSLQANSHMRLHQQPPSPSYHLPSIRFAQVVQSVGVRVVRSVLAGGRFWSFLCLGVKYGAG